MKCKRIQDWIDPTVLTLAIAEMIRAGLTLPYFYEAFLVKFNGSYVVP
jgi:hypothetical protein